MTFKAQNKEGKFCVTFVFCVDYIHVYRENGQVCLKSYLLTLCFSSPKSIKFYLWELISFRKYTVFSTLPNIKKMPLCTSDTLKICNAANSGDESLLVYVHVQHAKAHSKIVIVRYSRGRGLIQFHSRF